MRFYRSWLWLRSTSAPKRRASTTRDIQAARAPWPNLAARASNMIEQAMTISTDVREDRLARARALRAGLREPFRVDRRSAPRWRVDGQATLLGLGERMGVMAELDALEGSPWWLSGRAANPVDIGTRVSVGFSDPAARPANGEVIRCELCQRGRYQIALRFRDDIL